MKMWKCSVCGYVHSGESPPKECPQCSSSSEEFVIFEKAEKLSFDGKKIDVLLINGSSHKSHNSGLVADLMEKALKEKKLSFKRVNLNELEIQHCWCCYSMAEKACTYPCRNQLDDMPALHEMIVSSKAAIIISPINWNNMSARLKDFLDRTTCLQNLPLLGKQSLTAGKVVGIFVVGHEDGAMKTAMDIFVYFEQMGYIMAPFGFGYRTHGAHSKAESDNEFLKNDGKLEKDIHGIVNNVAEIINLNPEKLRKNLKPVCE